MHFVPVIIMHYIIRSVGTTCGPRVLMNRTTVVGLKIREAHVGVIRLPF